ncbi:hypothetical protein OC845_004114 [Tilletia horrida]|nr:hypothetical protein OC845_004114 [Tilletia horrida]
MDDAGRQFSGSSSEAQSTWSIANTSRTPASESSLLKNQIGGSVAPAPLRKSNSGRSVGKTLAQRRARGATTTMESAPAQQQKRHTPYGSRRGGHQPSSSQATATLHSPYPDPSSQPPTSGMPSSFSDASFFGSGSLSTYTSSSAATPLSPSSGFQWPVLGPAFPGIASSSLSSLRRRSSFDSSGISEALRGMSQIRHPESMPAPAPAPLSGHALDFVPAPDVWGVLPHDNTRLHLDVAGDLLPASTSSGHPDDSMIPDASIWPSNLQRNVFPEGPSAADPISTVPTDGTWSTGGTTYPMSSAQSNLSHSHSAGHLSQGQHSGPISTGSTNSSGQLSPNDSRLLDTRSAASSSAGHNAPLGMFFSPRHQYPLPPNVSVVSSPSPMGPFSVASGSPASSAPSAPSIYRDSDQSMLGGVPMTFNPSSRSQDYSIHQQSAPVSPGEAILLPAAMITPQQQQQHVQGPDQPYGQQQLLSAMQQQQHPPSGSQNFGAPTSYPWNASPLHPPPAPSQINRSFVDMQLHDWRSGGSASTSPHHHQPQQLSRPGTSSYLHEPSSTHPMALPSVLAPSYAPPGSNRTSPAQSTAFLPVPEHSANNTGDHASGGNHQM